MVLVDDAPALARPTRRRPGPRLRTPLPRTPPLGTAIRAIALLGFAAVYVVDSWQYLTARAGLNHDGQNLGVFTMGSRSIREAGPVAARLGSHLALSDVVYANHPPLIYWVTAASETLFGVHPWSSRLPTVLAALSLIVLVPRLLRTLGYRADVAVIATVASLGSVMFFVYGSMLDTPMLGLPVAVAVLTEWVRHDRGDAPSARMLVALTVISCLTGWEGVVLCALAAGAGWIRWRRDPVRRVAFRHMALTVVVALAVTALWIRWSYGSFDDIARQFLFRTGESDTTFTVGEALRVQSRALGDVFGWALLAIGGAGAVLARGRTELRRPITLVVVVIVGYGAVFWSAASYHDYWHEWLIVPLAIGVAELTTLAAQRWGRFAHVGAAIVALGLLASTVWGGSSAETEAVNGFRVTALLDAAGRPADQSTIYVLGLGEPSGWISYDTGLPTRSIRLSDLHDAATAHPDWRVLIYCAAPRTDGGPSPCPAIDDAEARTAGGVMSVPLGIADARL